LEQRWQHFTEASAKSREFEEHREFIAKAMETMEFYEGEDKEEILEHLAWAKFNIERLDPAGNPKLLLPKVKEPTAADLEQYLPARYQRARGWY
jgi:ribonucleotide reductase alpha subunit